MTDFAVRPLAESEFREAHTTMRIALHGDPLTDELWQSIVPNLRPGRYFGAVADGTVLGTAYVYDSSIAVPGGAVVPMGALTRVGVRADHKRRGILTELMRTQLADARERGQIIGGLIASESRIYGRFGYGTGTYGRTVRLRDAVVRPDVPYSGHMRFVGKDEAKGLLPTLYERIGLHRPGMMGRPVDWWPFAQRTLRQGSLLAVHSGPAGDDGYVVYSVSSSDQYDDQPNARAVITVQDMHAADAGVQNDIWRFLIEVDLVREVRAQHRPVDEPVELTLADPRACKTLEVGDHLWLRLVDTLAALRARTYGDAEPVAVAVNDKFLPVNSGTYVVSRDGVVRADRAADLTLNTEELAMIYLGTTRPSALAAAGRAEACSQSVLTRADKLFASDQIAWCGTGF
ncbi:MAG: GNAT family N-acetyltransferase [Kibdelosporangium sp.]